MSETSKYNEYELAYPRPWGIPIDIWWDKSEGAGVRRAQWVVNNCPQVSLEELQYSFALQPDQIEQLNLESINQIEGTE